MFSAGHLIWIAISFVLIAGGLSICLRTGPDMKRLLKVCLILGILSEIIKIFSVAQILPLVEPVIRTSGGGAAMEYVHTGQFSPFIKKEHLPLELCSLQIVFIAAALWSPNEKWKTRFQSLIFVTGIIGGLLGILLASVASECETLADFFNQPRIWQFFIYHSMIVMLGLYIGFHRDSLVSIKCMKDSILAILSIDIMSFYMNSIFSEAVYVDQEPTGLVYSTNFFSSYINPIGLPLTEKWQWLLYLAIRLLLAVTLILILFLIQRMVQGARKTPGRRS